MSVTREQMLRHNLGGHCDLANKHLNYTNNDSKNAFYHAGALILKYAFHQALCCSRKNLIKGRFFFEKNIKGRLRSKTTCAIFTL